MYSLFPDLFDYALMAPFVLRLVTGVYFVLFGLMLARAIRLSSETTAIKGALGLFAAAQIIVGALLCIGAATQAAALSGLALALISHTMHIGTFPHASGRHIQVLLAANCLALLFLGPGFLSVDLPL